VVSQDDWEGKNAVFAAAVDNYNGNGDGKVSDAGVGVVDS